MLHFLVGQPFPQPVGNYYRVSLDPFRLQDLFAFATTLSSVGISDAV